MDSIVVFVAFCGGWGFGMGFYSWLMYTRLAEIGQSIASLAGAVNENSKMMSDLLTEKKNE